MVRPWYDATILQHSGTRPIEASARPDIPGASLGNRADSTTARILVIDGDASVRDSMIDALAGVGADNADLEPEPVESDGDGEDYSVAV